MSAQVKKTQDEQINDYEIQFRFISDSIMELNQKIDTVLTRLSSIELDMAQLKAQMNHMDKRIDRLEKDMDRHDTEIKGLSKFIWTQIGGLATQQVLATLLIQLFGK